MGNQSRHKARARHIDEWTAWLAFLCGRRALWPFTNALAEESLYFVCIVDINSNFLSYVSVRFPMRMDYTITLSVAFYV